MPIPKTVARFNRVGLNRLTRHIAPWAPGFGLVRHRGRRSGATYETPVNVFPTSSGVRIALIRPRHRLGQERRRGRRLRAAHPGQHAGVDNTNGGARPGTFGDQAVRAQGSSRVTGGRLPRPQSDSLVGVKGRGVWMMTHPV